MGDSVQHPTHPHTLQLCTRSGWRCDVCLKLCKNSPRWRCASGCDWDSCQACLDKVKPVALMKVEVDSSHLDTKNEEAIKEAIRKEGVRVLEMLQNQERERQSAELRLLVIIKNVQKNLITRVLKEADDFGFQNDVASYLVELNAAAIRQELVQGLKHALLTASVTANNPVVMTAESIIWEIDDELARRASAERALQRALELAKERKEESSRQILERAYDGALKHGVLESAPLVKEAREFSAKMLEAQQKKIEKELELRFAIEDARNALDDSKRRFLLVLLFGGIVIAAAAAWAALVITG